MSNDELEPCPFCGSADITIDATGIWTGNEMRVTRYEIHHHCHEGFFIKVSALGKENCIAKWNRRSKQEG